MTCQAKGCDKPVLRSTGGRTPALYCSKACRQREGVRRYRASHREAYVQYMRDWRAVNQDRVNADHRAATVKRDIERLRRTPRCMICSKPLTAKQVRGGVTCSRACAQTRYSWFVRGSKTSAA